MKLPFQKQNNANTDVPAEIQNYYQSEKRQRTGVAWLLALGTLIVTLLVATLLFFAGRWVLQQMFGDDDTPQTTIQQSEDEASQGADTTPADNPNTGVNGSNSQSGTSSTNTTTPSGSGAPAPAGPSTTPAVNGQDTSPAQSSLPRTGPSEE